jgi:Predicted phosphohydrolases
MRKFKIVEYNIQSDKIASKKPFQIVMLSDLHNCEYGKGNIQLLEQIKTINPKMVLISGDMIVGSDTNMKRTMDFLKELVQYFPVYYANGNHEQKAKVGKKDIAIAYRKYKSVLERVGIVFLDNKSKRLTIEETVLHLYGYDLPLPYYKKFCYKKIKSENITQAIGRIKKNGYHILLAHNPMHFQAYAEWGADLTLAGHLHGGIIRLPFMGGVMASQVQLFPKYDRGLYTIEDKKMIVSAGLGEHTIKLRINNPTQLVIINLHG